MASVYDLKPAFQRLLRPAVRRLAELGVTPNQLTVAALALSLGEGAALALHPGAAAPLLALPAVLLARMALNAMDGLLAREHAMTSPLGALLNEAGDLLADAALYLPLALIPGISAAAVVAAVTLGLIAETTGLAALLIGASRRYDGPFGKSDRALLFGAFALAAGLGLPLQGWDTPLLLILSLLALATLINRVRNALAEIAR
ncbi:CDP-alcohol phosphatidyltransferase family protein [Endothiovibrio diazotrophicus]